MTEKERAEERKKMEVWERGGRENSEEKKKKKQENYGEKLKATLCNVLREKAKKIEQERLKLILLACISIRPPPNLSTFCSVTKKTQKTLKWT